MWTVLFRNPYIYRDWCAAKRIARSAWAAICDLRCQAPPPCWVMMLLPIPFLLLLVPIGSWVALWIASVELLAIGLGVATYAREARAGTAPLSVLSGNSVRREVCSRFVAVMFPVFMLWLSGLIFFPLGYNHLHSHKDAAMCFGVWLTVGLYSAAAGAIALALSSRGRTVGNTLVSLGSGVFLLSLFLSCLGYAISNFILSAASIALHLKAYACAEALFAKLIACVHLTLSLQPLYGHAEFLNNVLEASSSIDALCIVLDCLLACAVLAIAMVKFAANVRCDELLAAAGTSDSAAHKRLAIAGWTLTCSGVPAQQTISPDLDYAAKRLRSTGWPYYFSWHHLHRRVFGSRALPGGILCPTIMIGGLLCFYFAHGRQYGIEWLNIAFVSVLALSAFNGAVRGAVANAAEHFQDTMPLLVMSGLTPQQILRDKFWTLFCGMSGEWLVPLPFWMLTLLTSHPALALLAFAQPIAISFGICYGLSQGIVFTPTGFGFPTTCEKSSTWHAIVVLAFLYALVTIPLLVVYWVPAKEMFKTMTDILIANLNPFLLVDELGSDHIMHGYALFMLQCLVAVTLARILWGMTLVFMSRIFGENEARRSAEIIPRAIV